MANIYELPYGSGAIVQDHITFVSPVFSDQNRAGFYIESMYCDRIIVMNDSIKDETIAFTQMNTERNHLLEAIRLS